MLDVTYLLVDRSLTLDNSPVFQAQVLDWIRIQRTCGIKVGVVSTIADDDRFECVVGKVLRDYKVPYETIAQSSLVRNVTCASVILRRLDREHRCRAVYSRGVWGAVAHCLAYPGGDPPLIYDFRGDIVAEAELRGRGRHRQLLLKGLTRWAVRRAESVMCVSKAAADLLACEYGKRGARIIPSSVDADRFRQAQDQRAAVRESLGVKGTDLLLVYAGGLNRYQMIPEMLRLWAAIGDCPGIHFLLLLSTQPTDRQGLAEEVLSSRENVQVRSVPRAEVPMYLAAADVGFLLRQDHPVNRVASPVKFGEYLASGLAIVTSPGLGDVSQMVVSRRLGILVQPDDTTRAAMATRGFLEEVRKDREGFRLRAQQAVVAEGLDWKAHLEVWKQVLGLSGGDRSENS